MVSPGPVLSSALSSKTSAILVASIEGDGDISTTVGSSIVFPSVSSPSSLTSVTSLILPGLLAVTITVFSILPVSEAEASII